MGGNVSEAASAQVQAVALDVASVSCSSATSALVDSTAIAAFFRKVVFQVFLVLGWFFPDLVQDFFWAAGGHSSPLTLIL